MSRLELCVNYFNAESVIKTNQDESHIHNECEIYLHLSGDVSFEVEGRIYPVKRGSVIVTQPYEYHHCRIHSPEDHEYFWITFCAEPSEEYLSLFYQREKGRDNLLFFDEIQLGQMCRELFAILNTKGDLLEKRIHTLRFFHLFKEGKPQDCLIGEENLSADVVKALGYMDEHLTEDMDVEALARAAHVSANTLERHFRASMGALPMETLQKKRLLVSLSHLRNGQSVTEAAFRSGFWDSSHYIQRFKKQFGMTPLQYKKQFMKN